MFRAHAGQAARRRTSQTVMAMSSADNANSQPPRAEAVGPALLPVLRGVPGRFLDHHPDHDPDRAGPVLAGILAVVLPGQLGIERPADVGRHGYPAAQLDVVLRVRGVDHGDADPRVTPHVAV